MVKLAELGKEKKGTIELQVGDGKEDVVSFLWHAPRGLYWTGIQNQMVSGKITEEQGMAMLLAECIDEYQDETGKHKFTDKTVPQLGSWADILVNELVKVALPNFRRNK